MTGGRLVCVFGSLVPLEERRDQRSEKGSLGIKKMEKRIALNIFDFFEKTSKDAADFTKYVSTEWQRCFTSCPCTVAIQIRLIARTKRSYRTACRSEWLATHLTNGWPCGSKGWHRLNMETLSNEDAWVKILTTSGLSGLQHQPG